MARMRAVLIAAGMPELVAEDSDAFIRIAVDLAGDRAKLRSFRDHLDKGRQGLALFDSGTFCRNLERAYEIMVARARHGLEPDHLDL